MSKRRPAYGIIALAALVAVGLSLSRGGALGGGDRSAALAGALAERGLAVDVGGVLWLDKPPIPTATAALGGTAAIVRAAPGADEPHDIYLVMAGLSPEGVLLDVGGAYNLTETSAVDEQRPVGGGTLIAFTERSMLAAEEEAEGGSRNIRVIDLAGASSEATRSWSRVERVQAALAKLQQTGQLRGVERVTYVVQPAPKQLDVAGREDRILVTADGREAAIAAGALQEVPAWLSVERVAERRPGNVVTWAVDRVRTVIGDNAMQYIKAVAFSALDVVLSSKEAVTGDTGEDDIAADLGQEELDPATRAIPVDPEIGFPPPPLEPWVSPPLPGEGVWNSKADDPFIHQLDGLPPTFVTTFIRSDQRRKATRVYIALWDPRLVRLNMMAGLAEPKSATGATGPGMIPREPAVLRRVAAAMNAGFQALHGEYGMMSDGVIYLPPKPYGATVATTRDGSVAFGSWPNDPVIPEDILSYRQNMTVIVYEQKFNPYGRTWWGGTPAEWEDRTHTVRTGICLTKENFVGYFYGADLSPNALARAMMLARCDYGIALDMNAGHSGLEFYKVAPTAELGALPRPARGDWEREGKVRSMDGWSFRARRLIRGMGLMNFPRYIGREGRDFFYLTLRDVLPGPPLSPSGAPPAPGAPTAAVSPTDDGRVEDGQWRVKNLPQHGFPYALAVTEIALASGVRARVLKMDPRMVTTSQERAVADKDGTPGLLALVNPRGAAAPDRPSLWVSRAAFSLSPSPPVAGAVRLLSAEVPAPAQAVAALGVQQVEGMLLYVELDPTAKPIKAATLTALVRDLGGDPAMPLSERWSLALGGDSDLASRAIRLPEQDDQVRLLRANGPGARRIFKDTPIVPLKEWYPLQSRRIRYFKEKKKKDE